ncbi:hypothetical protein AAG906_027327 [Vitis piasezkii]
MGNSCVKLKKSTAEIAPCEFVKDSPPVVILYGSPVVPLTSYIRFALHHKCVSVRMVSAETPILWPDTLVLQCGSDTVSGSRETLMRYIESRFPRPPLVMSRGGDCDETTPLIVTATRLQHRSMTWHIERMVRWAEDLAARGGRGAVDPTVGSPRMEVKKFGRSYGHLLELMLEHAQMEERIVFPILERADRGLSKAANDDHARDLPIMNGIKEDIKSIVVLDSGTPAYQEALSNLFTRLKSLQEHCKEHFDEEERDLLPLMEAAELSKQQHERLLEQCWDAMQGTHSHLFRFFIEGLPPHDAMSYLGLIIKCNDKDRAATMLCPIME